MAAPKPMTKNQVLDHMAKKTKVTKKFAGEFIDEFVKLSYKEAKKSFVIPGLGKLVVVKLQRMQFYNRQRISVRT